MSQASSALGTVMACNEVDPSLILTEQCKQKVSSYATNEDNYSANKAETIKQLQKTIGSTENQLYSGNDKQNEDEGTYHHVEDNIDT